MTLTGSQLSPWTGNFGYLWVSLPAYSPELNPIENLWHYLKSHHWSNRAYADYDALFQAAEDAWNAACLQPHHIQTICAAPYSDHATIG